MELAKSFEPADIERRWYPEWEAKGYFDAGLDTANPDAFCILLPPPNVTGTLHMGHGFNQAIMDALTRYHRMRGDNTLWQPGTDHAGIATQIVVERQLDAQGVSRHDLGREKFLEKVWEWKEFSGNTITKQMRRLGTSPDWKRERFTMDAGLSKIVTETFVRLHKEGLIYRGKRLVNWDPKLHTAVSDLEVVSEEEDGFLWHIRYPLADGSGSLTVATTRPETMLGDTAVMVHPEDPRYQHLIGKTVKLPLCEREIPIIADAYVDLEFGTGCVKVTPAHDFNDYAVGQRHDLPIISILTLDAKINDNAPEKYRGLDRFDARKAVVADLEALGVLEKTDKHKLKVPRGDRTGVVIEPMLTDQWFVAMSKPGADGTSITQKALDCVASGEIKFVPENWVNTYNQWLNNIQDWCISRQLWWGHQIPAWYGDNGEVFVAHDEAEARAQADQAGYAGVLTRDPDVLDTWYSSALWPFSTLDWTPEWPEKSNPALDLYLPSTVLVTGFDIIFFWVARMVMATKYFTGQVPFREVYINAIVRDAEGQKMSKSKGNTLDPLDLIDGIELEPLVAKSTRSLLIPQVREKVEKRIRKEYPDGIKAIGTDALRFTFAALASYSRTINFDLKRAEGYKAFCNKLWNAARFVLMNVGDSEVGMGDSEKPVTEAERWILTRLAQTLAEVEQHFVSYRFDHLAQALYEFVWNEYCDWFLELSKPALNGDDAAAAASTRHTLLVVLEAVLRALHPVIPFITEEIYQEVAGVFARSSMDAKNKPASLPVASTKSILQCSYPRAADFASDAAATAEIEWFKAVLSGIRRIRSEMNIAPGKTIPLLLAGGDATDRTRTAKFAAQIAFLARTETPQWIAPGATEPAAAAAVVGSLRVLIPLAGLIDLGAEQARLAKEIGRIEGEIRKCEGKLGNANFVANAPAEVVAQERQRIVEWNTQLAALREQAEKLKG